MNLKISLTMSQKKSMEVVFEDLCLKVYFTFVEALM